MPSSLERAGLVDVFNSVGGEWAGLYIGGRRALFSPHDVKEKFSSPEQDKVRFTEKLLEWCACCSAIEHAAGSIDSITSVPRITKGKHSISEAVSERVMYVLNVRL